MALVLRKILSTGGLYYYYPVLNTRGDIIELYGGPGALTARYTYDSWGKLISVVDANGATIGAGRFAHYVSLRYRGYYYDAETELYYLQSRYYDPEVGRFLNADDADFIGYSGENLSYNAFAYCENNAIVYADHTGTIKINALIKAFSKLMISSYAYIALTQRLENYNSSLANRLLGYRYIKQVDVSSFKGVYKYSYSFRDSMKLSADKYYINFYFGTKESWISYCNYYKNENFLILNTLKFIILTVISTPFTKTGMLLGGFDFIIAESGLFDIEREFAISSLGTLETNGSNYFIAIRGITKLEGFKEDAKIIYEGDEHVWPVVIK